MALSDFVAGFSVKSRLVLITVLVVPVVCFGLYLVVVIAPTTPGIIKAIAQGRSATFGPVGVGEFEEPEVKKCKLVVQETENIVHSLQASSATFADALEKQEEIYKKTMDARNEFMKMPVEQTKTMYYTTESVLNQHIEDVKTQSLIEQEIRNNIILSISNSIDYMNRIGAYCLEAR